MPLARRTYATRNREFLKFASQGAGLGYIRHCVLDRDSFPLVTVEEGNTTQKRLARKGQLIRRIRGTDTPAPAAGAVDRYAPYNGEAVAEDDLVVCADEIDMTYTEEGEGKAVGGYFLNCVFNVEGLIGYTGNEAAVQAAMPTCLFDE